MRLNKAEYNRKSRIEMTFNPALFGAEVRTFKKLLIRVSALCSFLGWLTVAVNGFYAEFRQNTKR